MRRVAVHAIRSLCRTAVAVPASLLFAACLPDFRSPPIGEAKACLENMRVTAGALRDFVRVVHMERVGGRTKEAGGLETYELDWEAEVEGVRSFGSSLYVGFSELEKGERRVVTGTATFEKKPTGWICSTVDRIAVKAG